MVKCTKCGTEAEDHVQICPNCGAEMPSPASKGIEVWVKIRLACLGVLVLLLVICWLMKL